MDLREGTPRPIMASAPDIFDELPWLTPTVRNRRKEQLLRHSRSALLLGAFAAPLLLGHGLLPWGGKDKNGASTPAAAETPSVIADPFAPKALRPLSPIEAEKWNSDVPLSHAKVAAASPFAVGSANATSMSRSLQCMTQAIYYEAANEPTDGQRAVAQVVLNRMRSPAYPHSVCGVVYQGSERSTGCQFTFTCDGSLSRVPSAAGWARASAVAAAALSGYVYAPIGWATNYHADYVVPYWAQSLEKIATIGRHIFYRWGGNAGTGSAFTSRYAGAEPDVTMRASLAAAGAEGVLPGLEGGITRVSSAERPVIDFAAPTAPVAGEPEKVEKRAGSEAPHPVVASGARWIIGGGPARTSSPAITADVARSAIASEKDSVALQ